MDKVTKQKIKHTLRKNGLTIFLGISVILLIIIALMNVSVKKEKIKKEKVASNIYYGCIKTEHEEKVLVITQANYFIENECLDDGSGEKYKELNTILYKSGLKQYSEGKYSLTEEMNESDLVQILTENNMVLDFKNKEYNDFCNR
ncbi:hypothetical protein [Ruminococcus albus]|uniref:Uncharacterized protein n=1 Tax=Ruminococcus albus (strain ATCC 27210 / DSM 20455 / JCM 14654 / NCDO 2250 / 7) TaxID=697329 RepID=E6UJU3_RUMA7|nr:hypothetical protein [Ruminococcus albus]ADU23939.1 hypothetical protein Rumal_3492 [Ruminococcus albus 7 = DSM 20455]